MPTLRELESKPRLAHRRGLLGGLCAGLQGVYGPRNSPIWRYCRVNVHLNIIPPYALDESP